jgi:hypothetical protein
MCYVITTQTFSLTKYIPSTLIEKIGYTMTQILAVYSHTWHDESSTRKPRRSAAEARGQGRHESPSPPSSASFSKQTELKKPKPRRRHPASPPSAARLLFLLLPPPPLTLRAAPPSATPRLLPATWERGLPRLFPPPPCSRGW